MYYVVDPVLVHYCGRAQLDHTYVFANFWEKVMVFEFLPHSYEGFENLGETGGVRIFAP